MNRVRNHISGFLVFAVSMGLPAIALSLKPVEQWFQGATGITKGNYSLVPDQSTSSCNPTGELDFFAREDHVMVIFQDHVMCEGVGPTPFIDVRRRGCTTTVATSEIDSGLSILKSRECEGRRSTAAVKSVQKTVLQKTDSGFYYREIRKSERWCLAYKHQVRVRTPRCSSPDSIISVKNLNRQRQV
jgi:hypothetical protein